MFLENNNKVITNIKFLRNLPEFLLSPMLAMIIIGGFTMDSFVHFSNSSASLSQNNILTDELNQNVNQM